MNQETRYINPLTDFGFKKIFGKMSNIARLVNMSPADLAKYNVNTQQQNKNVRNMLEKEFNYYLTHQSELLPQYNGKFIVIVGENVVGAYSDRSDAYYSSLEKYAPGTFMIQLCSPGDSAYTVRYYNRVSPVTVSAQ